ncbi:MAG: hypothetical protein AB7E81_06565 [Hyphomicrobiaceae bacterium]
MATLGDDERKRRQRLRSLAIGLALGALVIIFYVATIVRLGPNAVRRNDFGSSPPVVDVPTQQAPK